MPDSIDSKVLEFFSKYITVTAKKGETILRPDDPINFVFFVKSGVVRLYTISKDGNETTFNLLKPDSYFPMLSVITDIPNKYYYDGLTPTTVLKAPKNIFINFINNNPEVLFDLTKRILIGLNALLLSMENLTSGKAQNRVATMLTILTNRFGQKINNREILINLPLTHQQIANLVGLTRETTSLEIEKLIKKQLIKYDKHKIIVLEPEKLEEDIAI